MHTTINQVKSKSTTWDAVATRQSPGFKDAASASAPANVGTMLAQSSTNLQIGFQRPQTDAPGCKPRIIASKIRNLGGIASTGPGVYTQRKIQASTPGVTQNPLLSLSHPCYGLPQRLVGNLASLGINLIYPWQSSCLLGHGLMAGEKNLVYTAPTGGGKSLVADVLMLKRVLERKKAILVLPYVALVQEKLKWLRRAVEGVKRPLDVTTQGELRDFRDHRTIRVVGFFGGSKTRITWEDADIAICTIEKANSLVNSAVEEGTISDLGVVILDELHMIDDEHRGYLLELIATKLLSLEQEVQMIGMSATLSNTEDLARWLDAKYYQSKYKPIPIEEYLVYENKVYPAPTSSAFRGITSQLKGSQPGQPAVTPCRIIESSRHTELSRPMTNSVIALTMETVRAGHGVLVFCSSRAGCQVTASLIAGAMPTPEQIMPDLLEQRVEVLNSLRSLMLPLAETLEKTVIFGVAFHHAGLTGEERDIVADAYDRGTLKVIVATSSLAAGINLPARRVILQGARMGLDMVGPAMLRQMRGRAGRKGKDETGESYVCCQKEEFEEMKQLLEADLPPISSCLIPEKRGLKRAFLEVIAIRLATHENAIQDYIHKTLLYHTTGKSTLDTLISDTIAALTEHNLISKTIDDCYEATPLGQAIVAASLTPEDGIFVHSEVQRALQAFVMDGELHVFYLFTPVNLGFTEIDWSVFRNEIAGLDESDLRVLQSCRVNPAFVNRMANSSAPLPETNPKETEIARIYRRFYAALQLRALCAEIPVHAVASRFHTPRGFVQTLAQTCGAFAVGMQRFCARMPGWGLLGAVLEHAADRLQAGARADLLELARIPFVKSRTARCLWESGYRSLRAVAEADPEAVAQVLLLAQPKRRKIRGAEEEGFLRKVRGRAAIVVESAGTLWERDQVVDIEGEM